jgi:two-component system, NarL family, response regulator DevR
MCVRVFLAEDAEVMRKAIRHLLSEREDITLVGEAATLSEAIQKTQELRPDGIILDLHMADGAKQHLFNGTKLLAMSFANDDEAAALANKIGAAKLLDKLELSNELIPAILELAPERAVL